MAKEVSYIEYVVDGINKADGIIECMEIVQRAREEAIRAQNDKNEDVPTKKDMEDLENLVSQIKANMAAKQPVNTDNMAQALETALKERMAEGKNIHHAILNDNGYEIKDANKDDDEQEI